MILTRCSRPTKEHASVVMTRRSPSGFVSAWSASSIPRTLRANSTIACWKPPQVPTSGTPRSRANRIAASAPSMLT
jgi:hypothetical protein